MSDLSSSSKMTTPTCQPHVSVYFDTQTFQNEKEKLFKTGPSYVGHSLWVPEKGDWRSLPWENDGRILVNSGNQIELLSNICRHRQAIMLKGHGNSENIICPLHHWTYDLKGELMGAPHFNQQPCAKLPNYPLQHWRGLLFNSPQNIAEELKQVPFLKHINFSNYCLDSIKLNTMNCNWKTFIEVYLEDYHVDPFHPGLGRFVDCSDLKWYYGEQWSIQTVGINSGLRKPGSQTYKQWHQAVTEFNHGVEPDYGAIWMCFYPNITVEWYPNVLVISTLHPISPQQTLNVIEFYYPEEIHYFERRFIEAEQAAYFETAEEDDEIALRMDAGRKTLYDRGQNDTGPYQSPMEDGMLHFHEWYAKRMFSPLKETTSSTSLAAF